MTTEPVIATGRTFGPRKLVIIITGTKIIGRSNNVCQISPEYSTHHFVLKILVSIIALKELIIYIFL